MPSSGQLCSPGGIPATRRLCRHVCFIHAGMILHACMCVYVRACMRMYVHTHGRLRSSPSPLRPLVSCERSKKHHHHLQEVYRYIYIYIYTHTHTHTHTHKGVRNITIICKKTPSFASPPFATRLRLHCRCDRGFDIIPHHIITIIFILSVYIGGARRPALSRNQALAVVGK